MAQWTSLILTFSSEGIFNFFPVCITESYTIIRKLFFSHSDFGDTTKKLLLFSVSADTYSQWSSGNPISFMYQNPETFLEKKGFFPFIPDSSMQFRNILDYVFSRLRSTVALVLS